MEFNKAGTDIDTPALEFKKRCDMNHCVETADVTATEQNPEGGLAVRDSTQPDVGLFFPGMTVTGLVNAVESVSK